MLPERASAPAARGEAPDLLAGYFEHLSRTGLGHSLSGQSARAFLRRWPDPRRWACQPLAKRLAEPSYMTSFLMFLMVNGHLQPGYDYLVSRKLTSFWRDISVSPLRTEMERFQEAGEGIGYSRLNTMRYASQSVGRMLVQTGRRLDELTLADFQEVVAACHQRQEATGAGWGHYRVALNAAQRVLFHMGIVDTLPPSWEQPRTMGERMASVHAPLRASFVAYLERKMGTCQAKTPSVSTPVAKNSDLVAFGDGHFS